MKIRNSSFIISIGLKVIPIWRVGNSMKLDYSNMIRLKLLRELKNGKYAACARLPRETVLAEELEISRNHLRDVLAQLEREGFITRIHGVGTIINRHVLKVNYRMDIEIEFFDIIRQNGYQPGISMIHIQEMQADSEVAEKLQVPESTEVICVSRVCTADGKPAIYCEDILKKNLVKEAYEESDFEFPIFHFLKKRCYVDSYLDLTEIHPVLADEEISKLLEVSVGSPLLNMKEIDYDIDGNVIFYSRQYFVDEFFSHTVMRKNL